MKLELVGVGKTFKSATGEVSALNGVNLEVASHEFVILVGASGCGKSTLLNVIAGLEDEFEGKVIMDGKPIEGPGPERSMVFQDGALFPWLTVVKNVEFGLKRLRVPAPERREKALAYLEIVGLSAFVNANIHELSGGMRQRVAIARALAVEPQVLLMDEPFSALDAQTREDIYVELQKIWQRTGATILFVTHNVREAVTLGDRVILLRRPRSGQSSIQHEFMIDVERPRHIDDVEVTQVAKQISGALREGLNEASSDGVLA